LNLAIVILNWNGKTLLEQFLPTVIKFSKEASIYVADNASTDDSIGFLSTYFPEVIIIKNKENGGYAKGYNDALKNLKEDVFCLLNNDIEVTKDWLTPIIEHFKNSSKSEAIIQPKILDYKNKSKFEYAGAAGGFIDKYGYPYCRGRIFNSIEKDNNQYNKKDNIFWASGACLFIKSNVFKELNGFDEAYFAHMEEIDLCWRAQNLGYTVQYIPDSTVFHVGGATLENSNSQKTYLNFRNSLYTLVKNANGYVFILVLIRLILDGIAGFKYLCELKPKHAFALIKAHLAFYRRLPKLLKQRKSNNPSVKYYQKNSIVWLYYIKRKTTFKSL
jgi:GT2 family glycosyltransferase